MTNTELILLKRAVAALEKIAKHLDSVQDCVSDLADSVAVIETRTEKVVRYEDNRKDGDE